MVDGFDILWKKKLSAVDGNVFHKNLNGNNENMLIWISDREELRIILLTTHPVLMIRMKNTWKSLGAVFVFISFLVLHTGWYRLWSCQCHYPYYMTGNRDNCLTRNIIRFCRYNFIIWEKDKYYKINLDGIFIFGIVWSFNRKALLTDIIKRTFSFKS